MTYGNGVVASITRGAGPKYLLSGISYSGGGFHEDYDYGSPPDGDGNPASLTDNIGEWGFSFDCINRLTSATTPLGTAPSQPAGGSYEYDWVGNRLSPPSGEKMVFNKVDQLTRWPGMYSYTYDLSGNLTHVLLDGKTTEAAGQASQSMSREMPIRSGASSMT